MKLFGRAWANLSKIEVHVIYVKNTATYEEKVIRVVTSEEEARDIEHARGLSSAQTVEWETVEVRDAVNPLGIGDTIYLLSDGGNSDDKPEEYSPNVVAAFMRRKDVDEFLKDLRNHKHLIDVRVRTIRIGEPLA